MRRLHVGHRVFTPILLAAVGLITASPIVSESDCRHVGTFTGTGEELSKKCTRSLTRISLQDLEYAAMPAPSPSMVQRVTLLKSNMDVDEESNEMDDGPSTPSGFWRHGFAVVQNFSLPGNSMNFTLPRGSIRMLQDLRANLLSIRRKMHQKFRMGLGLQLQAQGTPLVTACILFPLLAFGVFTLVYCLHTAWGDISHEMHRSRRGLQGSAGSRSGLLKQPPESMGMLGTGMPTTTNAQPPSVMALLHSPRHLSIPSSAPPGDCGGVTPGIAHSERGKGKLSTTSPPVGIWPTVSRPGGSPASTVTRSHTGPYLCPELVVPEHNECTLLVPELEISEASPNGIISIDDVNNSAVLLTSYSIMPNPPKAPYEVPGNGKRLVLRSALEDVVVASCRDADPDPGGGPPGLTILSKTDEVCGMLRPSGPGSKNSFVVALWSGQKVLIRKDMQGHCTYATDEDGWLLACFEEKSPEAKRMLRISPQVDAGLITLTILGTKLMEIGAVAPRSSDVRRDGVHSF